MNRYQIYLNPESVNIFDQVASELDLSRSQIVRDWIDRIAKEYKKALTYTKKFHSKNDPLLKMMGIGRSSTGRISSDVDSIYFRD